MTQMKERIHFYDKCWRCFVCGHQIPEDIVEKLEAWKLEASSPGQARPDRTVGSVKPVIATLDRHVISVPKAKKKPKKKK